MTNIYHHHILEQFIKNKKAEDPLASDTPIQRRKYISLIERVLKAQRDVDNKEASGLFVFKSQFHVRADFEDNANAKILRVHSLTKEMNWDPAVEYIQTEFIKMERLK